jgi:hypothetical protein
MTCKLCGCAEKRDVIYTNMFKHLGICIDCVNRLNKKRDPEPPLALELK